MSTPLNKYNEVTMANTRFGNFSELSQGKKPMTAEEALAMFNQLVLLAQEFVPGAVSIRKVFEGKPREAVEELLDWIPGNAAYQNFIRGKDQDWVRNALDLAIFGKPFVRGATKVAEAIERMPMGNKKGFLNVAPFKNKQGQNYLIKATNDEELDLLNKSIDIAKNKDLISTEDANKLKNNLQSTYNDYLYKEKLINDNLINPNTTKKVTALKPIAKEDIKNKSYDDYDIAKKIGEKYKVSLKPHGKSLHGNEYYTMYDNDLPMLYSEDMIDASIGRHDLTNYNEIIPFVNKEARELLPGEGNTIRRIFSKDHNKELNTYKHVIEPTMFGDLKILNNTKASKNSINAGKEQSKKLENYVTPSDFYKIILGL